MTHEIYKAIPGYEGKYECSTLGNIRSLYDKNKNTRKIPLVIKTYDNNSGYRVVNIRAHNERKSFTRKVHRLVALTFLPNTHNKKFINHKDGNKTNNCVTNLEWVTGKENKVHAVRTGLIKTKMTKKIAKEIKLRFFAGEKQIDLARIVGVDQSYISKVVRGHKVPIL